jgi:drug/metabolite transporter (DMT)-like permease
MPPTGSDPAAAPPPTRGVALGLLAAVTFGAATPASKWLLQGAPPLVLAGLLYLGAALATAVPAWRQRRRPLPRADVLRLAGAVVAGGMLGPVLLLEALRVSLAGSVSLLLNLETAATALLGVWLFGESLGFAGWTGVAGIAAAGAVVSWSEGWPGALAALWVAGACLCWALDNHLTARIDGATPARTTFWKGASAGSANLLLGLAVAPAAPGPSTVAAALGVGAVAYGASVALYIAAAQQLGAIRAQAIFAAAPFVGAAASWYVLGEPVGGPQLAGAALFAGSVALLLRGRHAHAHVHAALEHVHAHRHDDGHHDHAHAGRVPPGRHVHWHRHEPQAHAHPHWPDLHHRHGHGACRDGR